MSIQKYAENIQLSQDVVNNNSTTNLFSPVYKFCISECYFPVPASPYPVQCDRNDRRDGLHFLKDLLDVSQVKIPRFVLISK